MENLIKDITEKVQDYIDEQYDYDDVLVVDKAAPLLMHPTGVKNEPTLWHGVCELLAYELACGGQVSLVNRLDRETSGITIIAKNAASAKELGKAMQRRDMRKEYLALVRGCPLWDSACCAEPILQMEQVAHTRIHVRQCCHPLGKPCRTDFEVLQRVPARAHLPAMALLRCRPLTGRMHQIRVHLAHLGFPIIGDKIYGGDEQNYLVFIETGWTPALEQRLFLPRHALHASALSFPLREQMITVTSPLPEDIAALLQCTPHPH